MSIVLSLFSMGIGMLITAIVLAGVVVWSKSRCEFLRMDLALGCFLCAFFGILISILGVIF